MRRREKARMYDCGSFPIEQFKEFFAGRVLPPCISLDSCTHIKDVKRFVETSIACLENNDRNSLFIPCYRRLRLLKDLLIKSEDW